MRGVVQVSPRVLLLLRQLLDASLQRRAVESDSDGCHQRLFTAAPFLNRTGGIAGCVADARKAGKAFVPEIGAFRLIAAKAWRKRSGVLAASRTLVSGS
jgi:hypothetical protein